MPSIKSPNAKQSYKMQALIIYLIICKRLYVDFGFNSEYIWYMDSSAQQYNLEDRCIVFAKATARFIGQCQKSIINNEYAKQLVRSSSSVGANYMEARESMSKKDFIHRIKVSKKEARESRYWLQLIQADQSLSSERNRLITESTELLKILSTIAAKVESQLVSKEK